MNLDFIANISYLNSLYFLLKEIAKNFYES